MSNSMFKNDRSLFRPWNHEPVANRLASEQNDFPPSHRPLMVMEDKCHEFSDCDDSSGSDVQSYGMLIFCCSKYSWLFMLFSFSLFALFFTLYSLLSTLYYSLLILFISPLSPTFITQNPTATIQTPPILTESSSSTRKNLAKLVLLSPMHRFR